MEEARNGREFMDWHAAAPREKRREFSLIAEKRPKRAGRKMNLFVVAAHGTRAHAGTVYTYREPVPTKTKRQVRDIIKKEKQAKT
jgi:hypothetical protein